MRNIKFLVLTFATLFMFSACGDKNKKKETTPKEEGPVKIVDDSTNTDKPVPPDYTDRVENIWQSGLSVVVDCVQKRVDETKQRGVRGYIVISATIGVSANPQNVKVTDKKLPVDKIEKCIEKNLSELTFPTWGYPVKTSYSYSIDVSY